MYYTYENGKLVAKGDQYENPSSYIQYGTNETGMNGGKANGWEQGVSDTASGVLSGMGFGPFVQMGKMAYNGMKSGNNDVGDGFASQFAPHHAILQTLDESKSAKTSKEKGDAALHGVLNLLGLHAVTGVLQGQKKRANEASASYMNSVNPFLFALDDKGLQFSNPKAKAPSPVGDKTGWLAALGSTIGSGIKQGMASNKKNEVAPNTEADLNQDQPKNLAFMQNPLGDNPAIDNSYKESATRFDVNRGDNGNSFMFQDKTGAQLDQTYNFKKGGKVNDPIVVNDKNDPRLQAYNDSLIAYSMNEYFRRTPFVSPSDPFFNNTQRALREGIHGVMKSSTIHVGGLVRPQFKKPDQTVVYQESRTKEPTFELNQEQRYLPQEEQHLEFDPIGLKKGTYFTRPRQQQEAGQGSIDYFDSKTGKLLKTMNYNKGGSVQVKGGKGNDDIALVDTNTGEDTGVRVEKDEMIVFSKKNVEALEKAIASGKKSAVFNIVKDQLSQHPEVKEGETMFAGGGKYSGLSDEDLKKQLETASDKKLGKYSLDEVWAIEKELDARGVKYKSPFNGIGMDNPVNKYLSEKLSNAAQLPQKFADQGDPIKDPKGYEKILQTKAEQLYIKRHGEPKVDLGGLGMKFDRKKLKAIEDEVRAQDIEKAKRGEGVNKVMPSDNEKPAYKERNAKDAFGMLFPDAEKAVQDAKSGTKDGIPVVKLDLSKDNNGQSGWSQPNTRTSTSSTTTTTTSGKRTASADNVNISDNSIAMKGVTQPDPSMLNVTDIAGKLQTPYAKTVDTEPETVKQDWLGDTLGYAGDALKLGLGMSAATKKLPEWTISDNWNEYMGKMKFMSNMGLSPEQKAQYLDTADRTYQYDLSNIYNLSNGNAGTVLGNIGRANMSRYRSGVDLAIADKNAELANNAVYGNWLGRDEQYRKSIFDENRNGLLMTKQAGMQLASDAIANMENRADYNKFYGKNSQLGKLQNLQLEEQQYNNDILKAQRDNAKNPEYWKTYNPWKTTSAEHQVATTNSINKDDATEQSGPKWNSKITDKILSHERSFGAPGGNPFFSGYNNSDWSNGRFEKEYVDEVRSEIPNFDSLPDKIKARLVDYKFNTGRSVGDLIHVASGKYTATDANNKKTLGNLTEEQIASLNSEDFGKKIDNAKLEIYKMTKQNDVNYKKNLNMNWIPRTNMWDNFEF